MKIWLAFLPLAFAVALPTAHAQTGKWPDKPVRVVVPFAEGGASGHVSRRPARGNDARPPGFMRVAAQELAHSTPEEFSRVIAKEITKWKRVVKVGNIKVQ